jgi:hypothetical protein
MGLKIIGSGFGRTGTMSLKRALDTIPETLLATADEVIQ